MPLPMVHLAVAVTMLPELDALEAPAFLLGNLAPDAIHMRPGWTGDDKRRVHLHLSSTDVPDGAQDAARDLILRWREQGVVIEPLHVGYITHVLTDLLWRAHVWLPLRRALPEEMDYAQGRALYYRETDEIDRQILRTAPWRDQVWRLLAEAQPADVPGMVSAKEIALWRQRTLAWFDHLAPVTEPLRHLTIDGVLSFAEDAAAQVQEWLEEWGSWPPTSWERCAT